MSYDDNNIKLRNSQIYFNSIYRETKRKSKKNSIRFQNRLSKNNNKIENKISFQRKRKKQLTIGPLSSTLESTIASSYKNQNDEESSPVSSEKITIKSKKLLQPKDEDMKFLFDIFYKNNQYNLRQTTKTTYSNRYHTNEGFDCSNYGSKMYDLIAIKKYLIKTQKKYNATGNIMLYQKYYYSSSKSSGNIMDSYQIQKLEDLIARYSLIIFLFLRCGKVNEAKEIFLVMLQENTKNINNIEHLIYSIYKVINRRINIYKDIPKLTYQLARVYSFIIKYSQLFNMTNYRNIYMDKYFQIKNLNYNFFMLKGSTRGFSSETRNQIKYWMSYSLHNAMYYTIYYRFPIKIPLICNHNIFCLYKNFDESSLTDSEKSLFIKNSYNQGILFYINNQKDEALTCLNSAKEKINLFSEEFGNATNINNKRSTQNILKKPKKEEIYEINGNKRIKKKSTINPFKIKFLDKTKKMKKNKSIILSDHKNKKNSLNDFSLSSLDLSSKKSKDMTSAVTNPKNELKLKIYKNFKKEKITISDIELLIEFGKEKGLLNEEPTSNSKGLDFLFKYKESFSCIKKKLTLPKGFRGSHIDFHTSIKIKDFFIPEKFKNPLLRKTELLMSVIELDKKNYIAAYEHVLQALYIVILLKLSGNSSYHKDFFNQQKIELNEYFKLIEDSYDQEMNFIQQFERSSSKSLLTINDRKSQANISVMSSLNMNNSSYNFNNNNLNSSYIIFENKEAENHFYKSYSNILNKESNENNDIQNNNDYNYIYNFSNQNNNDNDRKFVKEFEKFFIFLNHLSVYQIKILNETQPDNEKRNQLPLMFSDQFKDCLTRVQRNELDNVQTMTLSRYLILKDPNKWIVPNNLNYKFIKKRNDSLSNKRNSFHFNLDRYNFFDEAFMKTKEYKNYLSIINSDKATPEINEFLRRNKNFVIKIIKDSSELDINNIIKYPYIIIDPIKTYKRKIKREIKRMKDMKKKEKGKRPQTLTHSYARNKIFKHKNSNNIVNRRYSNDYGKNKDKKNKSVTIDIFRGKRLDSKNISKNENKLNFNEDLNESFEDYLLSPEFQSLEDE